jgi:geranylgeranyl diphosphate synthase type II
LSFERYLEAHQGLIEQALRERAFARWSAVPARLAEAMRYSVEGGGKRLRPVVVLAAAEAVRPGVPVPSAALDYACAVELVHTFSLIHDDLPAMDDDDLRRGKPTSHKVFGEALAILAGDALLSEAFALCGAVQGTTGAALCRELAAGAGAAGMVGGQVRDMALQPSATLEDLERSHLDKTGALIGASAAGGAVAAGAGETQVGELRAFGRVMGLAFQAADDLLDVVGDPALRGKRRGGDAAMGKPTVVSLLGIDGARARAFAHAEEAERLAGSLPNPERLVQLARFAAARVR